MFPNVVVKTQACHNDFSDNVLIQACYKTYNETFHVMADTFMKIMSHHIY